MQKDRAGKPLGFEKGANQFHLTEEDGQQAKRECPMWLRDGLAVIECVIMGVEEYENLSGVR
jgi:hypothetical protein